MEKKKIQYNPQPLFTFILAVYPHDNKSERSQQELRVRWREDLEKAADMQHSAE